MDNIFDLFYNSFEIQFGQYLQDKNLIVSAADGRVISIEKTTDPYKKRKAIKS